MIWFFTLPLFEQILVLYAAAVNFVVFLYFGYDKAKAERGRRRVSERHLWTLALIGGSVGALLGMHYFRHKTRKLSFQAGIGVILALQVWVVYWFFVPILRP